MSIAAMAESAAATSLPELPHHLYRYFRRLMYHPWVFGRPKQQAAYYLRVRSRAASIRQMQETTHPDGHSEISASLPSNTPHRGELPAPRLPFTRLEDRAPLNILTGDSPTIRNWSAQLRSPSYCRGSSDSVGRRVSVPSIKLEHSPDAVNSLFSALQGEHFPPIGSPYRVGIDSSTHLAQRIANLLSRYGPVIDGCSSSDEVIHSHKGKEELWIRAVVLACGPEPVWHPAFETCEPYQRARAVFLMHTTLHAPDRLERYHPDPFLCHLCTKECHGDPRILLSKVIDLCIEERNPPHSYSRRALLSRNTLKQVWCDHQPHRLPFLDSKLYIAQQRICNTNSPHQITSNKQILLRNMKELCVSSTCHHTFPRLLYPPQVRMLHQRLSSGLLSCAQVDKLIIPHLETLKAGGERSEDVELWIRLQALKIPLDTTSIENPKTNYFQAFISDDLRPTSASFSPEQPTSTSSYPDSFEQNLTVISNGLCGTVPDDTESWDFLKELQYEDIIKRILDSGPGSDLTPETLTRMWRERDLHPVLEIETFLDSSDIQSNVIISQDGHRSTVRLSRCACQEDLVPIDPGSLRLRKIQEMATVLHVEIPSETQQLLNWIMTDELYDKLLPLIPTKIDQKISRKFSERDLDSIDAVGDDCLARLILVLFKVAKSSGGARLVIDGRPFNDVLAEAIKKGLVPPIPPMLLPRIHEVIENLLRHKFLFGIDAKNFFYLFPITSQLKRLFGMMYGSRRGKFRKRCMKVLPMGITFAPHIAERTALLILDLLRARMTLNHPTINYYSTAWVDNFLFGCQSNDEAKIIEQEFRLLANEIGLILKPTEYTDEHGIFIALGLRFDVIRHVVSSNHHVVPLEGSTHTARQLLVFFGEANWNIYTVARLPMCLFPEFMSKVRNVCARGLHEGYDFKIDLSIRELLEIRLLAAVANKACMNTSFFHCPAPRNAIVSWSDFSTRHNTAGAVIQATPASAPAEIELVDKLTLPGTSTHRDVYDGEALAWGFTFGLSRTLALSTEPTWSVVDNQPWFRALLKGRSGTKFGDEILRRAVTLHYQTSQSISRWITSWITTHLMRADSISRLEQLELPPMTPVKYSYSSWSL